MLHVAYLALGVLGAAAGAYAGYCAGQAGAHYGMRLLARAAQDHH